MTAPVDPNRFEEMYRDQRTAHGLPAATPWESAAHNRSFSSSSRWCHQGRGARSSTGPGHHAIHYASKGLSSTGIDASPAAIERAKQNAHKAGVSVDFQLADATKLDGLDDRFDTVVDCAFYHVFSTEPELQKAYVKGAAPRHQTRGAAVHVRIRCAQRQRLQDAPIPVGGRFREVFPAGGWEITYLGPTTYQGNVSIETFETMAARNPDMADDEKPLVERLRVIEPWLIDGRVHMPFWEMHATRVG